MEVPKGITPELLIDQVHNTAPFIFDQKNPVEARGQGRNHRFLQVLREPKAKYDVLSYFELCLAAHHGTVASFIPTDVDNQIRFKLWNPRFSKEVTGQMVDWVEESLEWDSTTVSDRWIRSPESGEILSGHQGEWFSTAAAAYGACRKRDGDRAAHMAGLILREVLREVQIVDDLVRARQWIGVLTAAPLLAHNLGDLDRVIEQWGLPDGDPLKDAVFKAGHDPKPLIPALARLIGELNKATTADENHRHFSLRKVKALRKSRDFLIPIGPFFDDWGMKLAKSREMRPEDLGEVVEALIAGWEWLKCKPIGYPRALAGIEEGFEGGLNRLCQYLPARTARTLRSGDLRAKASVPRARFEAQWSQMALAFFKKHRS